MSRVRSCEANLQVSKGQGEAWLTLFDMQCGDEKKAEDEANADGEVSSCFRGVGETSTEQRLLMDFRVNCTGLFIRCY